MGDGIGISEMTMHFLAVENHVSSPSEPILNDILKENAQV